MGIGFEGRAWCAAGFMFMFGFMFRFGFGLPGEADAVEGAAGDAGVEAADFGEELAAGFEAVGQGVGAGELGEGGELFDGGDAEAAEARDVGALAGMDAGMGPEADGLDLAAGADEIEEAAFEEEHGGMVTKGIGNW